MKKTKIVFLATIGICLLSFIPSVAAPANVRPIEDFTATNDYVAAFLDPESNLIVFPHGFFVAPGVEVISDCEHHGSVLERDLKDGNIMYKIDLHVKGAYMLVGDYGINPFVFEGEMDYSFTVTIILYDGVYGGPVPNLLLIWFPDAFGLEEPIGEGVSSHITASGTGTFLVDAFGYTAGDTAKVKMNQVGLFGDAFWPVEIVFFH